MKMFSPFASKWILIFCVVFTFPRNSYSNKFSPTSTVILNAESDSKAETLHINDCKSSFTDDNSPKSISSFSGCVNLYQEKNCTGNFIIVKPNTPGLTNLDSWNSPGWTRAKINSIGPCEQCSNTTIENYKLQNKSSSAAATLYTLSEFRGHNRHIKINGCTILPSFLRRKSSSIDLQDNICIQLYANWNCSGSSIQIDKSTPKDFTSDLSLWNFDDKPVSISLCGYNCFDSSIRRTPKVRLYPGPNAITFYSKPPFRGTIKTVNVTYNECINFKNNLGTLGLKGSVESIETYGSCINLYEKENCNKTGNHILINESTPILFWDYKIKSIDRCPEPEPPYQNHTILYIVVSLVIVILLLSALVIELIVNRKSINDYVQVLNPKEIEEFHKGIATMSEDGDFFLLQQNQLPYDSKLEISREQFTLDRSLVLGQGEFGVVYKGEVNFTNLPQQFAVAVKAVKPFCDVEYVRAMLKEIKTMIYVGKHPNIVPLIGCNTENLQRSELFIMTELCPNGSLEKFLKNHRPSFVNLLNSDNSLINALSDDYTNLTTISERHFNTFHLLQWSFQIANGMMHLERKNVIHGDLAARNVLLDQSLNAKISDFGLSIQLYANVQYTKKTQTPLPWRHMAIESLKSLNFSIQSDVWSYGITLWEIFSLGDVPYPGRVWTDYFLDELITGLRPAKPKFAPSDMYELMKSCWVENPSFRPPFEVLTQNLIPKLEVCMNESSDCLYMACVERETEL